MTVERKTPASQRRQAEGITGVGITEQSVPGWAQKRVRRSLVRFRGEYLSPEALNANAAREASQARSSGDVASGHANAFPVGECAIGSGGRPRLESPAISPADRFSWNPSSIEFDGATGELLPCRSLETTQSRTVPKGLTGPHRKVASALAWNVAHLCQQFGTERVGFLTLTFADHVTDVREASRRFNSLATNVLKKRYGHFIRVLERQKSGRIHYHLLVALPDDIRTGADFEAFAKRDYKSANNHLRREWAFLRKTAVLYGFGRTELMPIRSDAAAMGQYVGKYIGKHLDQREERDKGARLVSYSGDARMATSKHMRLEKPSTEWRAKCLTFCRMIAAGKPHARIETMDDLRFELGPRWSYHWRDFILGLPPADLTIPF